MSPFPLTLFPSGSDIRRGDKDSQWLVHMPAMQTHNAILIFYILDHTVCKVEK